MKSFAGLHTLHNVQSDKLFNKNTFFVCVTLSDIAFPPVDLYVCYVGKRFELRTRRQENNLCLISMDILKSIFYLMLLLNL